MRVFIAARTLGEASSWRLTNLQMQKILYVAHMLHMGRTGSRLIDELFEAWEFGPVLPSLYRFAKSNKNGFINPFSHVETFVEGSLERCAVEDALALTRHLSASELIRLTHRAGGAWDRLYEPGLMSISIPDHEILTEFHSHMIASQDAVSWAEKMADEIEAAPSRYLDSERKRAFRARVLSGCLQ